MRKYAILKEPYKCNNKDSIYKIMLYQTKKEIFLYFYCSIDATRCSFDACYSDIEDVYEDWNEEIDECGWIDINEPLSACEKDSFI